MWKVMDFCLLLKTWVNKYGQKLLDSAKKPTTNTIKTASKSVIQKIAKATGALIGNKITDKITGISKKPVKELPNNDDGKEENMEITTDKKRYVSPEERQKIIDELRLVPINYWLIDANKIVTSQCIKWNTKKLQTRYRTYQINHLNLWQKIELK